MIGMDKVLLASRGSAGEPAPEGVSFDGVNDYLSRSSDLIGNVDSKTFTFSVWVYPSSLDGKLYYTGTSTDNFEIYSSGNDLYIQAKVGNSLIIQMLGNINDPLPENTYSHVAISLDLTSSANRYVSVNDEVITVTWNIYSNSNIDFTQGTHHIAAGSGAANKVKGRLSHVYLDYTYRDLSIETNRRLFITADGKPAANQAALNPILYLPMRDADTAHVNEGTGGDFVPNGVLDTAQRGANQWNCVASKFDGVDDYMVANSLGGSQTKLMTASTIVTMNESATHRLLYTNTSTPDTYSFILIITTSQVQFIARNSSNVRFMEGVLAISTPIGKQVSISLSLDTSDTGKRHLIIDGEDVTSSIAWTSYIDDFARESSQGIIGSYNDSTAGCTKMIQGEVYFDTTYIDLSTDNPFWDATLNKPKPVRQVLEETGATPLIAMSISADNPTLNLGTGGNFTLNGGGLVGARGASEYISRSVVVDGTKHLTGNVFCQSLIKWKSVDSGVTWTPTYSNAVTVTNIGNGTDNGHVSFYWGTSENINWALEESKLRVTDQLGFPKDLYKIVADNPNTVLALPFDDPTNFGKNLVGTDFTVVGAVASGADVTA